VLSPADTPRAHFGRATAFAFGLLAILLAGYACGGGIKVGEVRERNAPQDAPTSPLEQLNLEVFATLSTNDTSSPVWAPDSSRFAFTDHYLGRLMVYDLDTKTTFTAYDSAAPPAGVGDNRYNYENPCFRGDTELLSGPSWAGDFNATDPWSEALLVDIDKATASGFGSWGTRPQVSPGGQILLETQEGLRLLDEGGTEIRTYEGLYSARWSPDGTEFLALRRTDPYNPYATLVFVDANGAATATESAVTDAVWHPDGGGAVFVRGSGENMYVPGGSFGGLFYYDREEGKARPLARSARRPRFLNAPPLVFYESPRGVAVSDLENSRLLDSQGEATPEPSPDGTFLTTVKLAGNTGYGYGYGYGYGSSEITVYTVRFDRGVRKKVW